MPPCNLSFGNGEPAENEQSKKSKKLPQKSFLQPDPFFYFFSRGNCKFSKIKEIKKPPKHPQNLQIFFPTLKWFFLLKISLV